jgi:protein phosphatase 1 regulatory subunit 42
MQDKGVTLNLLVACATDTRKSSSLPLDKLQASLLRSSHIRLNNRQLTRLENLALCPNARVLYVFTNLLTDLAPACESKLLEEIFAMNNKIRALPPSLGSQLTSLRKLYLNSNCLILFSGWAEVTGSVLEELHLAYQSSLEPLQLELASIRAISDSLRVLDLTGNRLQTLAPLRELRSLRVLLADSNDLRDPSDILDALNVCADTLEEVSLLNNPVCSNTFRDAVVLTCPKLLSFNCQPVGEAERSFIARKATRNEALRAMTIKN